MSTDPSQQPPPSDPYHAPTSPPGPGAPGPKSDKKLVAGLLGILIGCLGIHKFYLGYQKEGIIMLVISVVSCGFAAPVIGIIGLIEGILYLTKTDEEFERTYVTGRKPWF